MTQVDWKTRHDDLLDRATRHLEHSAVNTEANIEALRPLVVVDALIRAGYHPYQGDGQKLARLLLVSLAEGWIKPPVTVETVWTVVGMFDPPALPDWPPFEGETLNDR